jgi:hypothetical protein
LYTEKNGGTCTVLIINQLRFMFKMIKYRNRNKGINIKLEDPMIERHDLDVVKKLILDCRC